MHLLPVTILSGYFIAATHPNGKHSQKVKSCVKWEERGRVGPGQGDGAKGKVYFVLNSSLILSVVGTCQFYPSK